MAVKVRNTSFPKEILLYSNSTEDLQIGGGDTHLKSSS